VSGLGTVWLNAAVPEARAGDVRIGQNATATLASFPGEDVWRTGDRDPADRAGRIAAR